MDSTLKCQIQTKFEPLSYYSWWHERWCYKMTEISWEHKEKLIPIIRVIDKELGLGLDQAELLKLNSELLEYPDSDHLRPLSFSLPIKQDLKVLLLKMLKFMGKVAKANDCKFRDCASKTIEKEDNGVRYYVNPDQASSPDSSNSNKSYRITRLDLGTYKNTGSGNIINKLYDCPGFEVLVMLLSNPSVYELMDGITLPFIVVPGIVIGKNYHLKFSYNCSSKEFTASCVWGADAFLGHTLAAYATD